MFNNNITTIRIPLAIILRTQPGELNGQCSAYDNHNHAHRHFLIFIPHYLRYNYVINTVEYIKSFKYLKII